MKTKEWLIRSRKDKNITQRQLAENIELSPYTIEQIEQGKRLGSAETWLKIENYFDNNENPKITYNSNELIEELKEDIIEFGKNNECILIYKTIGDTVVFTNYDFVVEEEPFNKEKELGKDEKYLITTFQYALEIFESQNNIL